MKLNKNNLLAPVLGAALLAGVSGLETKVNLSDKLNVLVGEIACDYNNNCQTITRDGLVNSLRNHATAESVANFYNENQNLGNGYLVDTSNVIELNEKAKFLSEQPIVRLILPINNIVQGGKDDYMHHHTREGVSEKAKVNYTLESGLLYNEGLSVFEDKINQNVKEYLGGNQ